MPNPNSEHIPYGSPAQRDRRLGHLIKSRNHSIRELGSQALITLPSVATGIIGLNMVLNELIPGDIDPKRVIFGIIYSILGGFGSAHTIPQAFDTASRLHTINSELNQLDALLEYQKAQ